MFNILFKILDNAGFKAARLLGAKDYLIMLMHFFQSFPAIFRERTLVPLDKHMSEVVLNVRLKRQRIRINLPFIDQQVQEECYAYGGVREIFIRNCYFRFHNLDRTKLKIVVDLGGNRGFFSTLCAPFASKIITVEPNSKYNEVIIANLKNANPLLQPIIVNKFVGGEGLVQQNMGSNISFDQILAENNLDYVDFLKIDIEGSEFGLFQTGLPFHKIRYISLEVHREFGDPIVLIKILKKNNFRVISSTADFKKTDSTNEIDYIYAQNENFKI